MPFVIGREKKIEPEVSLCVSSSGQEKRQRRRKFYGLKIERGRTRWPRHFEGRR